MSESSSNSELNYVFPHFSLHEDPGDYTALVADSDVFFDIIDDDTRRVCIEVVIINDTLLEITESFSIEVVPDPFVANFPSNVQLEPALTFVKILDNDCKCHISASYTTVDPLCIIKFVG